MQATSVSGRTTAFVEVEVSRVLELRIFVQSLLLLAPPMAISTRFLLLLSFLCCSSQMACAITETVRMDPCGNEPMYQNGSFSVATESVDKGAPGAECCSLWVAIPPKAGQYPVVQFQHGFKLNNTDYTGLLTQVASWGFIVVAPKMYEFKPTSATTEINNARTILKWMKTGLIASLPSAYAKHEPNFDKVVLAGHSRGGQIVFGLALNYGNELPQYSAIVGLDPVDGTKWLFPPQILKNSLNVGVPTLIVGTGLGSEPRWGLKFLACAPEKRGHINFYKDLTPPSFHFVATESGHMDFTDDCCGWDQLRQVRCWPVCKAGSISRQCMRQFSAGIMVAFLQDVLFQNNASLLAALTQEVPALVPLGLPECKLKGNIFCTSEAHQYADI